MGIPGLTTYVNGQSGVFYKDKALHDTVLLVDGNNLASQIYLNLTVTNSAFGGDYERYKHSVQKFMALLLSCNILPIVVFDGGYEVRKLKSTVKRLTNTIRGVKSFSSVNQLNNVKLFPIFMKEVFKEVLKNLSIPCVQSDLEADFDLVYLCRKFKCPVLSYDSDFILNDVEYIPFYGIAKGYKDCKSSTTGKGLPCKQYRVDQLFNHFGGLSKEFLPLFQCMLGNDYISHVHFKSILSKCNFRYTSTKKSPVSKRLAVLIKWCRSQRSLETALAKIIETLRINNKRHAIKMLKQSIKEYQTEDSLLYPYIIEQIHLYGLENKLEELQYTAELQAESIHAIVNKYDDSFSYDSDNSIDSAVANSDEMEKSNDDDTDNEIPNEEYYDDDEVLDKKDDSEDGLLEDDDNVLDEKEDNNNDDDEEVLDEDGEVEDDNNEELDEEEHMDNSADASDDSACAENEEKEPLDNKFKVKGKNIKQFNSNYLKIKWLVHEFRHGRLSNHVANIINIRNIYLLPLRENINLSSIHEVSFDLLKTIGCLLLSDFYANKCLRVYTRGGWKMRVVRLHCENASTVEDSATRNDTLIQNFSIQNVPNYDLAYRRHLLLEYLKLPHLEDNSDLFPQEWNLFILSLLYWGRTSLHVDSYHIKSLIISFIYLNIVQSHCGYCDSTSALRRKYSKKLNGIHAKIDAEKVEKKRAKAAQLRKKRQAKHSQANVKAEDKVLTNDTQPSNIKATENVDSSLKNQGRDVSNENYKDNNISNQNSKENNISYQNSKENNISNQNSKENDSFNSSILSLVNTVNMDQLILLYEKLFPLSHLDEKLKSNHTSFGKDVIHTFCEYQSLFYFTTMLNSILNFPFQQIDMARIYSGTLLYNVYIKILNKDSNVSLLFENCNEMYEVYQFILKYVEERTEGTVFDLNVKKTGRRKKKKKRKEEVDTEESEVVEEMSDDGVIDSDNIYSILQKVHI